MKKEEVLKLMASSKNEAEWNDNCDKVKAKNKGVYPSFWREEVVLSGLMDKTVGDGSSQIKFQTI